MEKMLQSRVQFGSRLFNTLAIGLDRIMVYGWPPEQNFVIFLQPDKACSKLSLHAQTYQSMGNLRCTRSYLASVNTAFPPPPLSEVSHVFDVCPHTRSFWGSIYTGRVSHLCEFVHVFCTANQFERSSGRKDKFS